MSNLIKLLKQVKPRHNTTTTMKYKKTNQNKNSKNTIKKHTKSQHKDKPALPPPGYQSTYITELIDKYYDNDLVANEYLRTAHKKMHVFPAHQRIIVIGDIHGDLEAALKCLIVAKCIEYIELPAHKTVPVMDAFFKTLKWVGGDTYVVQLGDQIDRIRPQKWDANNIASPRINDFEDEGSTLEIFYLFYHLDRLARVHGGRVFSIIGNHEIMNVDGDFRYVSPEEFRCFKEHIGWKYQRNSKYPYQSKSLRNSRNRMTKYRTPIGFRERSYAFSPTGLCANLIADNYYSMLQIGKWLFCHGGPTMETCGTYPIEMLNSVVSMYLMGIDSTQSQIEKHYEKIMHPDIPDPHMDPDSDTHPDHDEDSNPSIIWNRVFGANPATKANTTQKLDTILDTILAAYNKINHGNAIPIHARYIAIGHTPQNSSQGINAICDNRVWRCDIAMSKAFNNGIQKNNQKSNRIQVLEITDDNNPTILE